MRQRHDPSQRGFGLVEMMISMLIGLFLLGGMMTIFITNKQAYRYQQAQGNQDDHERLATTMLSQLLRQAGHTPMNFLSLSGKANALPAVGSTFAAGQAVNGTAANHSVDYPSRSGSVSSTFSNDTVTLRFLGGSGIIDCSGEAVPVNEQRVLVFSLQDRMLQCSNSDDSSTDQLDLIGDTHAPPDQQLRVLGLKALWGLDTNDDGAIDVFQQAGDVADWLAVRAIDLELTFQSGTRAPRTTHITTELPNVAGGV